jgi:hypothetical protein
MITSINELHAMNAVMGEYLRAACAAKIVRLTGRVPARVEWWHHAGGADLVAIDRDAAGFGAIDQVATLREPDPLPDGLLREFVALITPQDESMYERTSWASCSMGALVDNLDLLAREGAGRVRIEVRPL